MLNPARTECTITTNEWSSLEIVSRQLTQSHVREGDSFVRNFVMTHRISDRRAMAAQGKVPHRVFVSWMTEAVSQVVADCQVAAAGGRHLPARLITAALLGIAAIVGWHWSACRSTASRINAVGGYTPIAWQLNLLAAYLGVQVTAESSKSLPANGCGSACRFAEVGLETQRWLVLAA